MALKNKPKYRAIWFKIIQSFIPFYFSNFGHIRRWDQRAVYILYSNRYTAIKRMRRSVCTRGGFWTLNTELAHPLFSRQRKEYHSRLAQLISIKKGEDYAKAISWIRARTSLALLRSALICLRGSRARRKPFCDFKNVHIDIEVREGAIM